MTVTPDIPQKYAAKLQLAMIAGNEPATSLFEIRSKRPNGQGMAQDWIPVGELDRAAAAITNRGQTTDVYVGAAPRVRRAGGTDAVERVWCLWADADTPEAADALRKFRPLPSIVLRSGSGGNLHAWWQLSESTTPYSAKRANRRLAKALGADRAATDAARIMRLAGSRNHKHEPATPVECVRLELDAFELADLIRGLPDDEAYVPRPRAPARVHSLNGSSALAGLSKFVRQAAPTERNNSLNWAAFHAGGHIASGALTFEDAEYELLDAALAVGLPEPEARRTIASGLFAGERQAA